MNGRVVLYQYIIFAVQWLLMILGFGILTKYVAPLNLLAPNIFPGRYFDAGVKALIALGLSILWLFIWDRQVRIYFYKRGK